MGNRCLPALQQLICFKIFRFNFEKQEKDKNSKLIIENFEMEIPTFSNLTVDLF